MDDPTQEAKNCPNCGAPMRLDDHHSLLRCDYCSTVWIPNADLDGVRTLDQPTELSCPLCRQALVVAALDTLRLLKCPNCSGAWIPRPAFALAVRYLRLRVPESEAPPRPADRRELERSLYCPACRKRMETYTYAGPGNVVMDSCSNCDHVWLDYSELHRILSAPGRDKQDWIRRRKLG